MLKMITLKLTKIKVDFSLLNSNNNIYRKTVSLCGLLKDFIKIS